MSKISAKTEQVYREGKMRRGQFVPKGAPKKIYQYWAKHADRVPPVENFCHFWRVVVFWAPLMKIRLTAVKMAEKPGTWIALAILYVLVFLGLTVAVDIGFITAFVLPYIFVSAIGIVAGVEGYGILNEPGDIDARWLFWVTAPLSIPLYLITKGLRAISKDAWKKIGIAAAALVAVGVIVTSVILIVMGFLNDIWFMLQMLGLIVGIIAAATVLVLGTDFVWSYYSNKRKQAYADALQAFYDGDGPDPDLPRQKPVTVSSPSWLERKIVGFFKGIWDFIVLAANVVRVNKWKICPIVTIDEEQV